MVGSKKTLYIILIVGLVIFVVSLAIGRPLWQAALFGIGFLLIAAIITSRGLLIPEIVSDRTLSREPSDGEPTEGVSKADFLKKMDLVLAELSSKPGAKTEDVYRMTEYTAVMKEVGELVFAVHESVRSNDRVKELRAFREVIKGLPRLISRFKYIPEIAALGKGTMESKARGLDLYLLACSNFTEAIETGDGGLASLAAKQINEALDLLALIDKSQLLREK
jgi:hypothetical protein